MSKVATFEFNTNQKKEAITPKLLSYGFDAQVVEIPMEERARKRKEKLRRIFPVVQRKAKLHPLEKAKAKPALLAFHRKSSSRRLSQEPVSIKKQYLLYLAAHDYRGEAGAYLKTLVQIAKYLLEIINDEGIYYYRNDIGEEFGAENTESIRAEEIPSYPPDMNEPYPTRYFINRGSTDKKT